MKKSILIRSRMRIPQGLIYWREIGQGTPILFLHGTFSTGSEWLPTVDKLGLNYHCLAPDLLGFGESIHLGKANYSIEFEVDSLDKYLEFLHIKKVIIVGHSLGGWIASRFAVKYPQKVRGLILVSPLGLHDPTFDDPEARSLVGNFPWLYWWTKFIYPFAKLFKKHHHAQKILLRRKELWRSFGTCYILYRRSYRQIKAEFLSSQLPNIQTPTLILQGSHDNKANITRSENYASLIPNAKINIIENQYHSFHQEQPDLMAKFIREFITRK